jgi:hypothetical protein
MEKLAVFIDYENYCCPTEGLERLLNELGKRGPLLIKRAYADWVRCADVRKQFLAQQVEMIEVPNSVTGKNSVDIRLVVDAMEFALRKDFLTTFVIVSADADYLPLLQRLREYDRKSIVVSASSTTSSLIQRHCDEYINGDPYLKRSLKKDTKLHLGEAEPKNSVRSSTASSSSKPVCHFPITKAQLQHLQKVLSEVWDGFGAEHRMNASRLASKMKAVDPNLKWQDYGCKNFQTLVAHLVSCSYLKLELTGGKETLIGLGLPYTSTVSLVQASNEPDCEPEPPRSSNHNSHEETATYSFLQPQLELFPAETEESKLPYIKSEGNLNSIVAICLADSADESPAHSLFSDVKRQFRGAHAMRPPALKCFQSFMKFLQSLETEGQIALRWCRETESFFVRSDRFTPDTSADSLPSGPAVASLVVNDKP